MRAVLLDGPVLEAIARGAAVLGAGGGGDTGVGLLIAQQAIEESAPPELVALKDLPPDDLIMPCGGMGAPTVSFEKIENGDEGARLREHVERTFGKPVVAVMASEIGGSNALTPIGWAARMGLPVVDADGMGRAFPELHQVSMHVAGISPSPAFLTDERGNVVITRAVDGPWLERINRQITIEMGGTASTAEYILTVEQAKTAAVAGSMTLAVRIGNATVGAPDPLEALIGELSAVRLVDGKITDLERRTTKGFAFGLATIEGIRSDTGRTIHVEIQNENLVAREGDRVLATAPDLITILDWETAAAIPTERLKYGQRVTVIAFACAPIWRTPQGIAVAGPRAFGYDIDYVPVEDLHA